MKSTYVTFTTAQRLKEAGYPQPDFATGQVWYNEHGAATLITKNEGEGVFLVTSLVTGRQDRFTPTKEGATFAPFVTDLLERIQNVKETHPNLYFHQSDKVFVCDDWAHNYDDENAADAVAMVWLSDLIPPAR